MKFKDAEKKLKGIFQDEYYLLRYDKTHISNGIVETTCSIYAARLPNFYTGNTWEEAFESLDKALNPQNHVEDIPNE